MDYYHGTTYKMPVGFELKAQADGYVSSDEVKELEALFEAQRPSDKISRRTAVFISNDLELIDPSGAFTDVIYRVKPTGNIERSDLAWYTEAEEHLDNGDLEKATHCAVQYWEGVRYPKKSNSCIEYRCLGATVIGIAELNIEECELSELPL